MMNPFHDEVSLDPPLPVYLFNLVASLRDKTAKGYPIKKVCIRSDLHIRSCDNLRQLLLVLWKTLLTCWGGIREHSRVKKIARKLAGLPQVSEASSKHLHFKGPDSIHQKACYS